MGAAAHRAIEEKRVVEIAEYIEQLRN